MEKNLISSRRLFSLLRRVFVLLAILTGCFHAETVMALNITVRGTVKDAKGTALNAITVNVKGTNIGTTTDTDGKFKLMVPDAKSVLVFSSIGFTSREITVGSETDMNVVLTAGNNAMDEVIVIGYGTQRKKDVTGAISSVSAKQ